MANNDLVNSLMRGVEMVKMVGRSSKGLRLNEIASAMDLKVTTARNLLRTLEAGGFLDRRNNLYFFGHELQALARGCENGMLGLLGEKALLSLYRKFPDIILIFAMVQPEGVAQTLRMSYDRPGVIQHVDYELLHPYTSAAGLLGLAFADPSGVALQEERRPFAEFGAPYWKERGELDRFLERVRQERLAISPFDSELFTRISTGVFDDQGKLLAVLGVNAPGRFPEDEMLRCCSELRTQAGEIAGHL